MNHYTLCCYLTGIVSICTLCAGFFFRIMSAILNYPRTKRAIIDEYIFFFVWRVASYSTKHIIQGKPFFFSSFVCIFILGRIEHFCICVCPNLVCGCVGTTHASDDGDEEKKNIRNYIQLCHTHASVCVLRVYKSERACIDKALTRAAQPNNLAMPTTCAC